MNDYFDVMPPQIHADPSKTDQSHPSTFSESLLR